MDITQLKALGRAKIIEMAIEEIRKKDKDFTPKGDVKVLASPKRIRVQLGIVFIADDVYGEHVVRSEELTVDLFKDQVLVSPHNYSPGGGLTMEDKAALAEVLKKTIPSSGERISIYPSKDGIEVLTSRGAAGGTERYRIDKATGEWHMLWHEHPMRGPEMTLVGMDGKPVKVEEEVFEELRERAQGNCERPTYPFFLNTKIFSFCMTLYNP